MTLNKDGEFTICPCCGAPFSEPGNFEYGGSTDVPAEPDQAVYNRAADALYAQQYVELRDFIQHAYQDAYGYELDGEDSEIALLVSAVEVMGRDLKRKRQRRGKKGTS